MDFGSWLLDRARSLFSDHILIRLVTGQLLFGQPPGSAGSQMVLSSAQASAEASGQIDPLIDHQTSDSLPIVAAHDSQFLLLVQTVAEVLEDGLGLA